MILELVKIWNIKIFSLYGINGLIFSLFHTHARMWAFLFFICGSVFLAGSVVCVVSDSVLALLLTELVPSLWGISLVSSIYSFGDVVAHVNLFWYFPATCPMNVHSICLTISNPFKIGGWWDFSLCGFLLDCALFIFGCMLTSKSTCQIFPGYISFFVLWLSFSWFSCGGSTSIILCGVGGQSTFRWPFKGYCVQWSHKWLSWWLALAYPGLLNSYFSSVLLRDLEITFLNLAWHFWWDTTSSTIFA